MNLILHITDIAFGGNGVARLDGKVFFVPFTAPGDVVRARIIRDKKKFAETQLLEILTPSPHRVAPPCAYFGKCGGCSYQHIAYEQQLEIKHRQVEQTLRRVGKFDNVPMRPIVPSPAPYHFRNRIRVHIENGIAGFYAHGSHALVPITHCEIAQPAVNEALHAIRQRPLHDGDYTLTGGTTGTYFSQTNDMVAAELLALVQREAKADHTHLIDAYCGAGFFAHALAPNYPQVTGIEENEHATTHARRVALENETYLTGDVANHLGTALAPPSFSTHPHSASHPASSAPSSTPCLPTSSTFLATPPPWPATSPSLHRTTHWKASPRSTCSPKPPKSKPSPSSGNRAT